MLLVPLRATRRQILSVVLGEQNVSLLVYQTIFGVFMDAEMSDGTAIISGAPCLNLTRIVRQPYIGFAGDLFFFDSHGRDDPEYTGLGNRFNLYYLEESELAASPFDLIYAAGGS